MLAFEPACRTTAMGIMPHHNIDGAIDLALSLDIPFWPQLPNVSYYGTGALYVRPNEHLFAVIFAGTAGQTYVANAFARVYQDRVLEDWIG